MLITATQIREGMILSIEGELYRVTYTMHVTPGKGVACMQTKMKHIVTGKNLEQRFRSNDKVDKAELSTKNMQFLYEDHDGYVFMDTDDYEQHTLSRELMGEQSKFLVADQNYAVSYYQGTAIGIELPQTVELKVTMAPPELRKATASAQNRPVELENGLTVLAPAFIKEGDVIRINTSTFEYMERV